MLNGEIYSYSLLAIDRAGNRSLISEWKKGIVGLAEIEYDPEEGGFIEYEDVALVIPKQQLPEGIEKITITEISSQELEEAMIFPQTGPIYEFSAYKTGSIIPEENIELENGYLAKLKYDESLLPEGFPEENLGVYHFDPMFGRWFQIPSAGVDIENNEIYFVTNHFSSFSVQATMIQDLTPQEYKDAGYSPLKAYVEHGGITVSPQFGTASTEVTELVLPGRNGFDFVLKRRYDTATARNDAFALGINVNIGINLTGPNKDYDVLQKVVDTFLEQTNWANTVKGNLIQMLEEYLFNQGDFAYSVGQGWRLNIPYIKDANSSMILRTADGTMHYINEMELVDVPLYIPKLKRTLVFEQHEGADFTLIVEQQYSPVDFMHLVAQSVSADNPDVMKNAIKSSWYSTGYTLILKDGTRYEMDALGRTTKMVDPTGQNQIEFHYDGVHLDYIKDSVGRIIRFEYRNDLLWPRIKKIWIENDPLGREINYDVGLDNLLYSVRDIAGRTSYYKYDTRLLYGGQAGVTFNIGDMILKLVGDILMGPVASLFGDDDIELFGNLKAQLVFPMEEMVAPGQGMTRINYNQPTLMYGKCDVKEIFDILPVSVTLSANLEQFLLTDKVDVYLDSRNKIKTVNFSYDFDYYKAQQPINFRTIENEGERKIVYNYKPVSQKRYRWEDKTYTIVKWEDASVIKQAFPVQYWTEHTLGVLDSMEIIDTTNDKRLQREEYQYDLDTMRIIAKRTIRDNESNLEKYRYDNWGNIIYYQNEDNGLERYMHYLNTSSSLDDFPSAYINLDDSDFYQVEVNKYIHNLMVDSFVLNQNPVGDPVPVHIHNVYSSNGKLILQANWDNQQNKWIKSRFTYDQYGNIIQQIDPLGNITEIDYDPEYNYAYPTTIIVKGKNGEAIRDVDGKPIKGDYIITQIGYYKSSGLKKWEIDGEGNLTEYEYDALGRLIKIIYPDDDDKYSGTIGSLKPEYYSNRDNNPVKIQHYDDDRLETTVINASRNIAVNDSRIYDNTITDPVYNKSRYVYDKLGRWIKLETFNLRENGTTEILTASFYYDKYNRQIAVQDAEGYITFTEYDVLDRETKVILPDGSKDLTNSKDNQIYTEIRYKGNMRTIIDGEGNRTEEISDWSGNLIEVNKYLNEEKISTRVKYDQLGNQVEIIDAEGRVLQRKYDSLGRLIEETLSEDEYIRPIAEKDWDKNNNFISQRYKPKKLYFYDDAGRRIKEISANSYWLYGLVNNTAVYSYEYDEAGNLIKETDPAGNTIRHYYDRNGNVVKTIDQEGNIIQREYTARGWLKAEALVNGALSNKADISAENGENDLITFYRYDLIGNRIAETGPEGVKKVSAAGEDVVILFDDDIYEHNERPYYKIDPEYTLHIEYNRLGWVVKEKRVVAGEEYTTNYEYDKNGNVKEIINPAGQRVVYNYTPQYWLSEEIRYDDSGKEYITAYQYDKVGNQILVTDPAGKRTSYAYDDLNRLESVTDEDGRTERYSYDRVGNMTVLINGRGISTKYEYNNQNQLVKVIDGENGVSNYYYDPEGNLMLKILPNGIKTAYIYDRRNQLVREIRPEGDVIKYSYDKAGNLIKEIDRKGQEISYSYRRDYLPLKIEYRDTEGNLLEYKEYTYDREGKRLTARNNDSLIRISYDPLGRIVSETRTIAGKIYTTAYKYDKVGNIIGIKYPGSYTYLQYEYNDLNQLVGVAGIADGSVQNPAFSYKDNGFLERIRYNNGTITNISPDRNYRIDRIEVINNNPGFNEKLLDISYRYDENNNVIKRINNLTEYSNQYHYDNLDRLVSADLEGTFYGERTGFIGIAEEDQLRYRALRVVEDYFVELDYRANSVGVILLEKTEIGKIVLTPLPGIINHRIRKETISVHYSDDNFIYLKVPEEDWEFEKDEQGRITITLKEAIPAVAFKVHSNHDDRNLYNEYVNLSTFKNNSDEIIKVYQRADEGKIEYSYDAGGNRLERHTIVGNDDITRYEYYKDSNRLKKAIYSISGKTYKEQYYIYDENGNLIAKGNEAKENPDGSLVLIKDSPSSIYWEYEYTSDNRLKRVYYNGELKAEYTYDADGMRIISDTEEVKTYFVFNYQGKAIFEENLSSSKTQQISFIYALNRQIARVEGIIGGDGEIIYYHHDNLGSTRLMTDESGEVVFDQDYLPFGGDLAVVGELEPVNEVNEGYKYTGQREEAVIGLYYYGARFYDPEMGRFITEDPAQDGINWYVYCGNNPLNRIDPTGLAWIFDYETWEWYATESSDTIHDLVKSAHFFSWQEAAEHAGIRDWYDDVGNVLGNRSLVGMRIKAPLDIYKAQSFAPELTIFEIGLNDIGIILSGNVTEVTVENVRTFDAFSTSLYSYILDSKEIGFSLPNISISFSTMYGAFPRHYSDFLTNEKHREELYKSLLGETKVHFTNFIIATYARVESDYWRGESASYGFGMGFKYKNYEIGGFGKGTLTQMTPYEQKLGFGKIKLISGHERLMKEKALYERYIGIANSSGLAASRGKVDYDWEGYLNSLIRAAEREYYKYWR